VNGKECVMRYALLIYGDENRWAGQSESDQAESTKVWDDYTKSLADQGVMRAGDALQPTATATSVRVREGKTLTTDGPFAETKEQFGGYYVIETDDIDVAIEAAARCPGAFEGTIEVRPIMEFPQP
jgi:hypothetical protein